MRCSVVECADQGEKRDGHKSNRSIQEKQLRRDGPAPGHFLLLRQKKVTKEKATQVRRPFGLPCGTRSDARLRNSAPAGPQTVLAANLSFSAPRVPTGPRPPSVPRRTHMGKAPKSLCSSTFPLPVRGEPVEP